MDSDYSKTGARMREALQDVQFYFLSVSATIAEFHENLASQKNPPHLRHVSKWMECINVSSSVIRFFMIDLDLTSHVKDESEDQKQFTGKD